jgi:hypothetical protein
MDAWLEELKAWRKDRKACREATDACLESNESTSVEIESVALHEEAPKEGDALKTVRAPKERYGPYSATRQLKNRA